MVCRCLILFLLALHFTTVFYSTGGAFIYKNASPGIHCMCINKRYSIPITGLWGPEGSGRLRLPDSVTSALEGGRLSALSTGRLYPQQYPGTHF
jgi:hypothetical protein